jgi:hypothetical protein
MVQREVPGLAQKNLGSNGKPKGGAKGSAEHGGPRVHSLEVPPKPEGYGFEGERCQLRFLALATCYGKDLHREANQRGMPAEIGRSADEGRVWCGGRKRRETFARPPRFRLAHETRKFYALH